MLVDSVWAAWALRTLKPLSSPAPRVNRTDEASTPADWRLREVTLQIDVSVTASRRNAVAGLLTVLGMGAVAAWRGNDTTQVAIWLCIALAGQVLAVWVLIATKAVGRLSTRTQGRLLTLLGAYCSIAWGTAAWLILPGQDSVGFIVLVVAAAVIFVGGASGIAHRPIVLALACPGPIVFAAGLLALPGSEHDLLAAGLVLVGLSTILISSSHMEAIRLAIHLGIENERLLEQSMRQQNIAEQARAEAEEARGRAELADRGKTNFLAAAGHDLRQPLHALVQYHAHLARQNKDPVLHDTVARIGKSLDAMRDLLDAMLEVSKLLTGTIRPELKHVRLDTVLDRLDAQMRPLAEAKGLTFSVVVDGGGVETDEVLLERILRNLVLNAIRYTQTGKVGLQARCHGKTCRILVWDTGIGIARSEQSKIFDEFYQVANEARDVRKGLGLGLAIVRQLGQLLKHPVRMRSMPGRGSVFAISLPLSDAATAQTDTNARHATPDYTRGAFLVLVDDNPDSLAATAETLRSFGAHVVAAASSLEAIDHLQAQEFAPQLIVSDYRLDGETGLDVIRVLRDNQKALFGDEFELGALLITGDTAPDELRKAQSVGVPLLHKPLSPDRLYAAVNEALARQARGG